MDQKVNQNNATINSNIVNRNTTTTKTTRKDYDADFKNQIIECNRGAYTSVAECARSYGINENTRHNWIHKYKNLSPANLNYEYVNLRKENAKLRMELETLKKAIIYFASHAK